MVKNTNKGEESFSELQAYSDSKSHGIDGPEILTYIRNAIVHSSEVKRKALSQTSALVMFQVLQLSIHYVELVTLYILNYNGLYFNRTSNAHWAGEGEEQVPWVDQ